MNTHKEESKDKYIEAREKVLDILIDEYKQNCNFDALMRIMAVVEEYGGTVKPTPPSQIEPSLLSMYELGKEHGRELALKDMEIEKLLKETEEML